MAKVSANTSVGDPIHTRTTAGTEESQAVVLVEDGTDNVVTVVQRGTVPGATSRGICVVPLNVQRPAYQYVTPEITPGTAIAVTRPLSLWHPATLAKDVFVLEIGANIGVMHTAGRYAFELEYITAESATGNAVTAANIQMLNRGDAQTGLSVRNSVTAETAAAAGVIQRAVQAPYSGTGAISSQSNYDGVVIYRAKDLDDYSDALLLRNGQAEGILVRHNILATLTGAPIYSVYARWVERA